MRYALLRRLSHDAVQPSRESLLALTISLAGAFVLYLVLGLLVRPLFAIFLRGADDSVLLVALMHSVFQPDNNENGIAAGLLDGEMRGVATFLAVRRSTWTQSACLTDAFSR